MKPEYIESRLKTLSCFLWLLAVVFLLTACPGESDQPAKDVTDATGTPEESGNVLATVNGSPVTGEELALLARRTYGADYKAKIDSATRNMLLESLIVARAIAVKAEVGLAETQKAEIERKTRAFREELLVRQYLEDHVPPQPVTDEMISTYYGSNPGEFGKRYHREYEMIISSDTSGTQQRQELLAALEDAGRNADWRQWTEGLEEEGYPVAYSKGVAREEALSDPLYRLIVSMDEGDISSPVFIRGRLYLVRVTGAIDVKARPLGEVREEIRRKLMPVAVKDAVRRAREQVLQEVEVVYKSEGRIN